MNPALQLVHEALTRSKAFQEEHLWTQFADRRWMPAEAAWAYCAIGALLCGGFPELTDWGYQPNRAEKETLYLECMRRLDEQAEKATEGLYLTALSFNDVYARKKSQVVALYQGAIDQVIQDMVNGEDHTDNAAGSVNDGEPHGGDRRDGGDAGPGEGIGGDEKGTFPGPPEE